MQHDAEPQGAGTPARPRVTLIGLGRIAWLLEKDRKRYHPCTHAGALRALAGSRTTDGFELSVACDIERSRLQAFRRWWQRPLIELTDHREALQQPADLIVVAASMQAHYAVADLAIRSGCRNLLLEKPVALTLPETRRLQRRARENGCRVWVNFERRYHPGYVRLKQLIEHDTLGPLRRVTGQVLTGGQTLAGEHPVGSLLHDGVHWLDLLLWYCGKPDRVVARVMHESGPRGRRGAEHTALIRMDYPGFTADLETGGRRSYFEFRMQCDFEHGRVVAGNDGHFYWKRRAAKHYSGFGALAAVRPPRLQKPSPRTPANPWLGLYREILAAVRDPRIQPTADLASAVEGMELVSAALKTRAR